MDNTVAYAVHVDGGLWDDPEISAWCTDPADAVACLKRAEDFFSNDEAFAVDQPFGGLLTIVRAVFTPDEWAKAMAHGWTRQAVA